jgi:hypothetical protein
MKIKSAAIIYKGTIYQGNSHCEIGLKMLKDKVCKKPYPAGDAQGFVTDTGEFVDRAKALIIAKENNQIIQKNGNQNILFSEDLKKT